MSLLRRRMMMHRMRENGVVYEASNLVFDGSGNDYIDTGVKLHDSEKDFRITCVFTANTSQSGLAYRYVFVSCNPANTTDDRNVSLCVRPRQSAYIWLDLRWGKRGSSGAVDVANLNVTADKYPVTLTFEKVGLTYKAIATDVNGSVLFNTTRNVVDANYHDTNLYLNMPPNIMQIYQQPCACIIHDFKVELI